MSETNTGDRNTGDRNTGDWNTGDWNTGNWNTGDWNTGNWNTGDCNTGYFNTENPREIDVFGKKCTVDDWAKAEKPNFLYFQLTEWVTLDKMTDQEKEAFPSCKTTGGYLKEYEYKEAFKKSWDKASKEDRALLFKLPNFDAEIFKEISGIDVTKDTELEEKKQALIAKANELLKQAEEL